MNMLDIILITLKLITFLLIFISAGGIIFYNLYSSELDKSKIFIKRTIFNLTITALIFSIIYLFFDAARFAGSYAGILDIELQKMILFSHLGVAKLMSILGLMTIILSYKTKSGSRMILSTIGVTLVAFSFTYTGHTAEHPYRLLLAPLLLLHLLVVLFWFGALLPLYFTVKMETNQKAGQIVNDFSKKATILVPLIFIAGFIVALFLMEGMNFLNHNYGLILLFKITVFSILMLVAALNKFHLGPALEAGKPAAAQKLQKAILLEIFLIFMVVTATVILTAYFSPK